MIVGWRQWHDLGKMPWCNGKALDMGFDRGITRRQLAAIGLGSVLPAPFVRPAGAQERAITFAGYSGIFQENYQAVVIDPFTKKTGIKVTYFALPSSAQILGTLRAQKAAPQVDVAIMDVTIAKAGTEEGLFEPFDAASVPAVAQLDKRALQAGVAGAALTFDNLVLLYAPETVKPAPTSWKVLWDKKYAGQIAIPGVPDIVGIGLVLMANRIFGGTDYRQGVEKGIAAVSDMAPDVLSWDPRPDPYSFITNGQAVLGVGWNARGQLYSAQSGGKLAAVLPDEGSLFQINMIEAVHGAKQPEASRLFLDYVLGVEAQTAFTERMFYAPTNAAAKPSAEAIAKTAASPERMAKMLDLDWVEVAKMRDALGEQWRRRVLTRR